MSVDSRVKTNSTWWVMILDESCMMMNILKNTFWFHEFFFPEILEIKSQYWLNVTQIKRIFDLKKWNVIFCPSLSSPPYIRNYFQNNTCPILLKNVDTKLGFCLKTSSPVSSIIVWPRIQSWNHTLKANSNYNFRLKKLCQKNLF